MRLLAPALAGMLCIGLLYPAGRDTIRGFDPVSQATEQKWEKLARAIPEPERIRKAMERLASQPHLAGTPQSEETAEYLLAQLREYGLDAHIERYEALLPQPKARTLEMTSPLAFRAKLEEPAVPGDPNSADSGVVPTFNAYSGDGDVTAPLVYVNYGVPADYDYLKSRGIDVKGRIVIARYGGSWRGIKPKVAFEHGAAGCLIYSDPKDDGYYQGDAYPKGPFRPADGVQRGSVMDMTLHAGDPLSPGWASESGAERLPLGEAATLMKIPVLPISWADAQPLLRNLGGPVAPESWRGALPFTYHLGAPSSSSSSPVQVHLKVEMDNSIRPLYDVIATIPGSDYPDQWVMFGNHHDAWVHGASDPLSGATAQLETARALAELTRQGWKPKRTVMIGFWDGEEYGLVGSTEYMEKHADELSRKLVAYINSDSNGAGKLGIEGSHTLEAFMQEVARDVPDPDGAKSLLEAKTAPKDFHIGPLGSGSDYTPFLQHLGIASLNLKFDSEDGGVYHSAYDDYNWYMHFSDSTFVHGRALAQLTATAVIRLADAPFLPFEFGRLLSTVSTYLDEIQKLSAVRTKVDLTPVRTELTRLARINTDFENAWNRALPKQKQTQNLAALNQLLYQSERSLTLDPGLPGRPWFRHRIYAPGKYTGYAVKTLPGIREAVELNNPAEAAEQTKQVVQVLHALGLQLEQATKTLGTL